MKARSFPKPLLLRSFCNQKEAHLETAIGAIRRLGGNAGKGIHLDVLEKVSGRRLGPTMDQLAQVRFTSLYEGYPNPNYRINFPADSPAVSYRQQTLHRARIFDHFPIRKALEPVVFELAASRMTPARIVKAMAMRERLKARIIDSSHRLDEEALARRVAGWSGSRLASDLVVFLWKMEGYAYAAIKARAETPAELHRTRREYIEILDRLICGDGPGARCLVQARLERLDHVYFKHIPKR